MILELTADHTLSGINDANGDPYNIRTLSSEAERSMNN